MQDRRDLCDDRRGKVQLGVTGAGLSINATARVY
jgi:hypothetical protein